MFKSGRRLFIDRNGIVAAYEMNTYVLHWKDEYYFALTSGSLDFLRFDDIDSWYFHIYYRGTDKSEKVWSWDRAWAYTWERSVFLGEIEVDYEYVDSIPKLLENLMGLLHVPDMSDVPDDLRDEFEKYLDRLIYGTG